MIKRTISCAVCDTSYTEEEQGAGLPQWGSVLGIELNGSPNPDLCTENLSTVEEFVNNLTTSKLNKVGN